MRSRVGFPVGLNKQTRLACWGKRSGSDSRPTLYRYVHVILGVVS